MNINCIIKHIRLHKNLTLEDMSHILEIPLSTLKKWENNQHTLDISILLKLIKTLDIDIDTLLSYTLVTQRIEINPTYHFNQYLSYFTSYLSLQKEENLLSALESINSYLLNLLEFYNTENKQQESSLIAKIHYHIHIQFHFLLFPCYSGLMQYYCHYQIKDMILQTLIAILEAITIFWNQQATLLYQNTDDIRIDQEAIENMQRYFFDSLVYDSDYQFLVKDDDCKNILRSFAKKHRYNL